jgi:hypothetical protein
MGEISALISPSLQPTSLIDFQPVIGLVRLANISQPDQQIDAANKMQKANRVIFMARDVA